MTANGLFPGFIQLTYKSIYGTHKATLPTRAWNSLGGTRGAGGYTAWDSSNRDALDMIEDYANDMALLLPDSSSVDSWIIFTIPAPGDDPIPVQAGVLATPGVDTTPGWFPAVQFTYTYFDSAFYPCKSVILDAASNGGFAKTAAPDLTSAELQLPGGFTDPINAWSSRAGNQPSVIRALTRTLNRSLRKKYGYT